MVLLHLLGAFALVCGLHHQRPRLLQHLDKFTHICRRGKRAMPRDDLRIWWSHAEDLLDPGNHAAHTPAAPHIHERKTIRDEIVAHMNHIRLWEENDTVPISVA